VILNELGVKFDDIKSSIEVQTDKFCIYVGIAVKESIRDRLKWDTYESIRETLEILSDEDLSKNLAIGIQQIHQNKLVDFDSFKQSLLCTQ